MHIRLVRKGDRDTEPVLQGEAIDVFRLLVMWGTADAYEVYDGEKYTDAREFVVGMGGSVRPADGSMTPEEKMRCEDLFDPIIHARNHTVEQLIARAIRLSHEQNYMPDLLAKNAAFEVIRLFY